VDLARPYETTAEIAIAKKAPSGSVIRSKDDRSIKVPISCPFSRLEEKKRPESRREPGEGTL